MPEKKPDNLNLTIEESNHLKSMNLRMEKVKGLRPAKENSLHL